MGDCSIAIVHLSLSGYSLVSEFESFPAITFFISSVLSLMSSSFALFSAPIASLAWFF